MFVHFAFSSARDVGKLAVKGDQMNFCHFFFNFNTFEMNKNLFLTKFLRIYARALLSLLPNANLSRKLIESGAPLFPRQREHADNNKTARLAMNHVRRPSNH